MPCHLFHLTQSLEKIKGGLFLRHMLNKGFYKHLCKNIQHLPAFLSVNAAVPVFKNQMCDNVE